MCVPNSRGSGPTPPIDSEISDSEISDAECRVGILRTTMTGGRDLAQTTFSEAGSLGLPLAMSRYAQHHSCRYDGRVS